MADKIKYHSFCCPWCLKKLYPNDIVFRYGDGSVDDAVLAYRRKHLLSENEAAKSYFEVIDPAFIENSTENMLIDSDGFLQSICIPSESSVSQELTMRLCPYCHNPLYKGSGKYPVISLSVLGATDAGKTAYLVALIEQLQVDGFSLKNVGYTANGQVNDYAENHLSEFCKGNILLDHSIEENAPIVYQIESPRGSMKSPFFLVIRMMDGQDFQEEKKLCAKEDFLTETDIIAILFDLEQPKNINIIANTIWRGFEEKIKRKKPFISMIISKSDQLQKNLPKFPNYLNFSSEVDHRNGKPLDDEYLLNNHCGIKEYIVEENLYLKEADRILSGMTSESKARWFLASALRTSERKDSSFDFKPLGCDTPILWALSQMGYY